MTTNRSLSWIDRGRFAGLLAQVTERASEEPAPPPARPRASAPVAKPSAMPPPRRQAPAIPAVPAIPVVPPPPEPLNIAPPPPPPAAPAVKVYPPFSSTSRNLEERLQALVSWIEACVPCRAAFIADDNGLPVVEHIGADPGQIAAASSILLMLASVRSLMRDSGGWLTSSSSARPTR
ncbi:MAG TPA: hypothetical protein VFP84_24215 [Kofleriaceae bacterium]|nr:hypothetical protein [Kofleriaceae bacterium]